jgi:phage-related protein
MAYDYYYGYYSYNYYPYLNSSIPNQTASEGNSFSYQIPSNTFYDTNGDQLYYSVYSNYYGYYSSLPSWLNFDSSSRRLSGTPPTGSPDLTIYVDVSDNRGGTSSTSFTLFTPGNHAPVASSYIPTQSTTEGQYFSYQVPSYVFTDADFDTLTYSASQTYGGSLPYWLSFNPSTRTFSGTVASGAADQLLRVTANDGRGGTAYTDFWLNTPAPVAVNHAPTVSYSVASQSATEGQAFTYQFSSGTFYDSDGDILAYSASQTNGNSLPSWLSFNASTRTFSGTAPLGSSDLYLRITANDGSGSSASTDFSLSTLAPTNRAPTVSSSIPNQTVTEGQVFTCQFSSSLFSDADGDTLTYTASQSNGSALPYWLGFNSSTRTFSGTVPTGSADLSLRVTVDDGRSGSAYTDFSLSTPAAAAVNHAPTVSSSIANQSATEGQTYSYQVPLGLFADADGDTLTYTATQTNGSAIPSWLSFNAGSRSLSGTVPTGAADLNLRILVDDGHSGTASADFALVTPSAAVVNHAPTVASSIANQSVTEGQAYSYQLPFGLFADADGDSLTYTATQTNGFALPYWLGFNGSSQSLSGTAPTGAADVNLRIIVDDGHGGAASTDFTLATPALTLVNHAPTVAGTIAIQSATEGQAYSYQLPIGLFADADGDTLTLSATQSNGSTLPYWLSFNASTKGFSGTPPGGTADLSLRVIADDGHGGAVSTDFALSTPAAAGGTNTGTTPDGTTGGTTGENTAPVSLGDMPDQILYADTAFKYIMPASTFHDADGDKLTYTASLDDGSRLPSWLKFRSSTRTFSGTVPSDAQDITVMVTARDPSGETAESYLALAVDNTDTGEMKYTFEAGVSNGKGDYDYYYGYTFDNGSRDYFVGQVIDGTDKKGNYSWYFINGEEPANRDATKDGNVYVESYFDSETGVTYTPKLFHAGKPSGVGQGLGFESDSIVSGTKSSKFGGAGYGVPFLEADLKISTSLIVFPS